MLLTVRSIEHVLLTASVLTACSVEARSRVRSVKCFAEATGRQESDHPAVPADPWVYKHN